jgi:hypothetical protein
VQEPIIQPLSPIQMMSSQSLEDEEDDSEFQDEEESPSGSREKSPIPHRVIRKHRRSDSPQPDKRKRRANNSYRRNSRSPKRIRSSNSDSDRVPIIRITGINHKDFDCERIYNIFSNYGNVIRVSCISCFSKYI